MPFLQKVPLRAAAQPLWQRALLLTLTLLSPACAGGPGTDAPHTGAPPSLIAEVAEPLPVAIRRLTGVRVHRGSEPSATTASGSTPSDSTPSDSTPSDSTMVTLDSDQALRWTTYRDLEGHLVVELPGTRNAAPTLIETDDQSLLISRIEISSSEDGFRGTPTTRLRVMARREAVHALEARGTSLALRFDPVAPPPGREAPRSVATREQPSSTPSGAGSAGQQTLAAHVSEPPAAPRKQPAIESESLDLPAVVVQPVRHPDAADDIAAAPPIPADVPAPPEEGTRGTTTLAEDLGIRSAAAVKDPVQASRTASQKPQSGAATSGRANVSDHLPPTGRTIFDLVARNEQGALVVEIRADGPLAWSAFRLRQPDRFVVDLPGAFSHAGSRTVPLDHPQAARARLGQFQPRPDPIARLVLDLDDPEAPVSVARTPTGLVLRIGEPR